jgi:hypothetical protein
MWSIPNTGDTLVFTRPGQDGDFGFTLKQGLYELHFAGEGYEELIRPLRIATTSNKKGIKLDEDITLALEEKPVKVFEGEESQIQLRDDRYEGVAGEVLNVPVRVPRGSTLVLRTYQDSVLVGPIPWKLTGAGPTWRSSPCPVSARWRLA